jgi:hypothetical protein
MTTADGTYPRRSTHQVNGGQHRAPNDDAATVPTLANITRHDGVVGEYSYSVEVTYPGQRTTVVKFSTGTFGKTYQVHMTTEDTTEAVSEAWRYGSPLSPEWIHKLYSSPDRVTRALRHHS